MRKEDIVQPINSNFVKDPNVQVIDAKQQLDESNMTFKTGTTTVGLVCKDVVVLGTDKRASMGYFVASKTADKLHKIQEHLYMTIAGTVADAMYLVDVLKAETTL